MFFNCLKYPGATTLLERVFVNFATFRLSVFFDCNSIHKVTKIIDVWHWQWRYIGLYCLSEHKIIVESNYIHESGEL